jgi:hypothetical protein
MKDKNKRTFYEVAEDIWGGWSYPTLDEAKKQIAEMSNGFPDNEHMSAENREYWKRASSRYQIFKVTTTRTLVS